MAKRGRRRVRTQRNRARTDRRVGSQGTTTPEKKDSHGAPQTNTDNKAQKPQSEWVTVEHRDPDGNPTLPKELIAGTARRRYEEMPEGTEIKATSTNRFPRTRGDRPATKGHMTPLFWVPPHTRG